MKSLNPLNPFIDRVINKQFEIQTYLSSKGFSFELTGDQSPTLRMLKKSHFQPLLSINKTENESISLPNDIPPESMHHSGGAASESIYIYQEALNIFKDLYEINKLSSTISIFSLGFGLGYNELITAYWCIKNNLPYHMISLFSYEKELFLYEDFNKWLNDIESPLNAIYDLALYKIISVNELNQPHFIENDVKIKSNEIKFYLKQLLTSRWKQNSELVGNIEDDLKFNVFLFDAFSKKTSPLFWSFDFLEHITKNNCQTPSVFSTYACLGELKRALKSNGFHVIKRPGFQGKRNSTMAYKSIDSSYN